jgi:hypothetical protein
VRPSPDAGGGGAATITVDFPAMRDAARDLDRLATASRSYERRPRAALVGVAAPSDALDRARHRVDAATDGVQRLTVLLDRAAAEISRREVAYRALENVDLADQVLAFAPVLVLHPDEDSRPTDPRPVLERAQRTVDYSFSEHVLRFLGGLAPPRGGIRPGPRGRPGRDLEIRPSDYDGERDAPRTLVETSRDGSRITYWFFHAFNDGPGPQNHEGDWERTTVHVRDGRPTHVVMSGHESHNTRRWDQMERTADGRPVIYSSRGSHALQPGPGRWRTDVYPFEDETRRSDDRIDFARLPVADIRDEPYYGTGDLHGRESNVPLGGTIGLDGPEAPGPGKSHIELDDAATKEPVGPRIRVGRTGWRPPMTPILPPFP